MSIKAKVHFTRSDIERGLLAGWRLIFTEDFEDGSWLGIWGVTVTDFAEDFEDPDWAGAWTSTIPDFAEDFQSWPVGPV